MKYVLGGTGIHIFLFLGHKLLDSVDESCDVGRIVVDENTDWRLEIAL
jgi:hypothetical protein